MRVVITTAVIFVAAGCSSGRSDGQAADIIEVPDYGTRPTELPPGSLRVGIPSCFNPFDKTVLERTHWLTPEKGYCRGAEGSDEYLCSYPGRIYDPVHHVIYLKNGDREDCIGYDVDWSDAGSWPSVWKDRCIPQQYCRCRQASCDGQKSNYNCDDQSDCPDDQVCERPSHVAECLGTTPK